MYTSDNVEFRVYASPRTYDTYYIPMDDLIICDVPDNIYQLCAGKSLEPVQLFEIAVCSCIQHEL